jgi:hypothetical protein
MATLRVFQQCVTRQVLEITVLYQEHENNLNFSEISLYYCKGACACL